MSLTELHLLELFYRANFSDMEIEILFCRYDKDMNGLDEKEVEKMLEDLHDGDFEEPTLESRPATSGGIEAGVSQGESVTREDMDE